MLKKILMNSLHQEHFPEINDTHFRLFCSWQDSIFEEILFLLQIYHLEKNPFVNALMQLSSLRSYLYTGSLLTPFI
jgi:hypothetical protein